MRVFKNIPFLRICIPFVLGILLSVIFNLNTINVFVLMVAILLSLILYYVKKQTASVKVVYLICLDVFLFGFGINLTSESRIINTINYYGKICHSDSLVKLIVLINDLPVEKEKFIKCQISVVGAKNDGKFIKTNGNLIAYFKKNNESVKLNYGQTLLVNSKLIEIESPKNPEEFNYKKYLEYKQIFHTCFIDSGAYQNLNLPSTLSYIWSLGLKTKQSVLKRLKNSELSNEAYSICAALLTGYDDDIDKSVMESFSHSGTLHVLSVSGLHTGLIYLVLAFIFDLFDRKKKHPLLKFAFVTLVLWFFALITGFSAPVLRAVIMFNLLGLGKIFFRNNYRNQINILLVSAFMLLCFNPFLIMDIGFQLSYFALFGILFFQPIFSNLWEPENKNATYIWQSITASFSATLTTLPFTLFYFKQFPIWFFICNLVVVPATFLVLLLGVLVVLNVGKTAIIINYIIQFLIWFINLFNSPNLGYIDNIDFGWVDAILLSSTIILFSVTFYHRSYKYLIYSVVIVVFWQVNNLFSSYQTKNKKIFTTYQIKKEPAYSIKNKQLVLKNAINKADYNYHVKPHLISFNYPILKDTLFNYLNLNNEITLILNKKNFWPNTNFKTVSTLVISNNFKLKEKELEEFSNLKLLVADGSNNNYQMKYLAKLCSKFGIEFYNTKSKGAYILNFKNLP